VLFLYQLVSMIPQFIFGVYMIPIGVDSVVLKVCKKKRKRKK